ncbi:hypothetical protein KQ51_01764 [Candidatus Izimaplasma bacterium HR1]|jgi:hypothetical protein|uniref:hypothetical protein n=1 Tax=Candidatus Izimoplasma sp. HR1 TaxID=1541959 RepID=UPI0004F859DB|nr:hypothetical protein KQ51_01764 [Candidatus Izimaplasma bacterium HR1]
MWKLFKHKEKNSLGILVVYLLAFAVYIITLLTREHNGDDAFAFYLFSWIAVMAEAFRYSLFNLSYYFANGSDYSITKPVISRLKTHLQLLSIKMSDFILYNIVYTGLRLLPFIVVTLLIKPDFFSLSFIGIFTFLFITKATIGPMTTIINSIKVDINLNNRDLSMKERREIIFDKVQNLYPNVNIKLFKVLNYLYIFGFLGVLGTVYIVAFPIFFEMFNINTYAVGAISIVGILIVITYGIYLNNIERKHDDELYQK